MSARCFRYSVTENIIKALWISGMLALSLVAAAAQAADAPPAYKEGVNYIPVMPAQPTSVNPGQIEVLEFFWYGNPQCFALEPYLETWAKSQPVNVVLTRVPAALNPQWDLAARAYYTAMQLGIGDKASAAIFAAIHVRHISLASMNDFENLFVREFGVGTPQFENVWNSLAVDTQLSRAKVLAQRYGVTSVPSFTVNGKWLTGTGYRLTTPQIMPAVNWLVQRELTALPAGAQ